MNKVNEKIKVEEFELVEDLKESMVENEDITTLNAKIEKKIKKYKLGTLLKVEKEIGSATTIINVDEVTPELAEKEIW